MTFHGADTAELRGLAQQFNGAAQRLEDARRTLTHHVGFAPWLGPIAELFRSDWNNQSARQLSHVAESLKAAARDVLRNADEQDRASGAGGQSAGGFDLLAAARAPLEALLNIGGAVADVAEEITKGSSGLPGKVLKNVAGPVLTVVGLVEGIAEGDHLKTALGVAGLVGIGVAVAVPPAGLAIGLGFVLTSLVAPTSDQEIRELRDFASRRDFGTHPDNLSSEQREQLDDRYDGAHALPNMIADKTQRQLADADSFFSGWCGR